MCTKDFLPIKLSPNGTLINFSLANATCDMNINNIEKAFCRWLSFLLNCSVSILMNFEMNEDQS